MKGEQNSFDNWGELDNLLNSLPVPIYTNLMRVNHELRLNTELRSKYRLSEDRLSHLVVPQIEEVEIDLIALKRTENLKPLAVFKINLKIADTKDTESSTLEKIIEIPQGGAYYLPEMIFETDFEQLALPDFLFFQVKGIDYESGRVTIGPIDSLANNEP